LGFETQYLVVQITVGHAVIRRATVIGITWPIPAELDDTALERKLFAPAGYNPPHLKPVA
jgi:hypothetical protein